MKTELEFQANRLENWLQQAAIPLWASVGINSSNGAVFERLQQSGVPDQDADMRSRVQSRQIFVFSLAQTMGWLNTSYDVVNGINQFLNNNARVNHCTVGYAHLLHANGQIKDSKRDAYDFAFFLLASAYQLKAFAKSNEQQHANQLLEFIESKFKANYGGWLEGDYSAEFRRQNPHMHLFEAFLTWYEVSGDGKWLAKAGQIYTLFETTFFDSEHGVLREYFTASWELAPFPKGGIVEPGHMFEWVWLLRWYEKLTATNVSHYCKILYENGLRIGLAGSNCLLFDEVDASGKVLKASKRLWPITELIKASAVQAQALPDNAEKYETFAAAGIKTLFDYYFCRSPDGTSNQQDLYYEGYNGRYIDQLDESNQVKAAHAPASTLYHIVTAAMVTLHYLKPSISHD